MVVDINLIVEGNTSENVQAHNSDASKNLPEITPNKFNEIHGAILGSVADINDTFHLELQLNKAEHKEFLSALCEYRMPSCKNITLDFIESEDIEKVKGFLHNSFPSQVQEFVFKNVGDLLDVGPYLESLIRVGPQITHEASISNQFFHQNSTLSLLLFTK